MQIACPDMIGALYGRGDDVPRLDTLIPWEFGHDQAGLMYASDIRKIR